MAITTTYLNNMLDALPNTVYLALFVGDPEELVQNAAELDILESQ